MKSILFKAIGSVGVVSIMYNDFCDFIRSNKMLQPPSNPSLGICDCAWNSGSIDSERKISY